MVDVQLKCECGKIRGIARGVSGSSGNRLVCHCEDCQAFANHLGQAQNPEQTHSQKVLDNYGGTDIFQMPLSKVEVTQGQEYIRCLRLTPKGLHRWYAQCCNTPLGNTMSSKVPFIGVIHSFMDDQGNRDQNLGPIQSYAFVRGDLPKERLQSSSVKLLIRIFSKLAIWKIRGLNKPSSFFNNDGTPISSPGVLSK